MRLILLSLLFLISANADIMIQKTLGCPSVVLLKKAPVSIADDVLNLNMYAIANDCVIISRRDSVEAIGYDPLNSEAIYQEIVYLKTGVNLYIKKSTIQIEQAGKKGVYRF